VKRSRRSRGAYKPRFHGPLSLACRVTLARCRLLPVKYCYPRRGDTPSSPRDSTVIYAASSAVFSLKPAMPANGYRHATRHGVQAYKQCLQRRDTGKSGVKRVESYCTAAMPRGCG